MTQYHYEIEETDNGFSAYVPELPGCVAAAETLEETEALIRDAIAMHLEALEQPVDVSVQLVDAAHMHRACVVPSSVSITVAVPAAWQAVAIESKVALGAGS